MDQLPEYADQRTLSWCAFCGGRIESRDHCPSRVLLDEPYPENLPVVPSCSRCNESFSPHERYVACLIDCVLTGGTDPDGVGRPKVRRMLRETPSLRARIDQALSSAGGGVAFRPELERVATVVTKLAQGHALYELHESCARPPPTSSRYRCY
jgi:hypothetical protein